MNQDFLIAGGGAVKSLGRNRVGGRVVTFSGPNDPDRVQEYFDQETDFWFRGSGERRPILFRHGMDQTLKRRRFGEVELSRASDGIWAEGSIKDTDRDARRLLAMVEAGEMRWSTGSVAHLVAREKRGDAYHLTEWPISECSLCPEDYAAEPRCVASLKSVYAAGGPSFADLTNQSAEMRAREIYLQLLQWKLEQHMRELGILDR